MLRGAREGAAKVTSRRIVPRTHEELRPGEKGMEN